MSNDLPASSTHATDLWGNPAPEPPQPEAPTPTYDAIVAQMPERTRAYLDTIPWGERDAYAQAWQATMQATMQRRQKARAREHRRWQAGNPLIAIHGAGPDGATCGTCSHLYRKTFDKVYWKCDQRKDTNGPGSDHRKKWAACGKYQAKATKATAETQGETQHAED